MTVKSMTEIIFKLPNGEEKRVEAGEAFTLMEVATRNDIAGIEADCGGACACATCHVYVDPKFLSQLPPKEEAEEDMLDFAFDVQENSRLSCQIKLSENLNGMVVTVPEKQY